jgi:hypothetical protein
MNLLLIIGHMRSNKVLGWYKRIKKRMQAGIHITSPYHVLAKAIENLAQVSLFNQVERGVRPI